MGEYKMRVNYRKLLVTILSIGLITLILMTFFILNSNKIYKGVSINGIPVGGLNIIEASKYVENQLEQPLKSRKIQLVYKEYALDVKYEDIGVSYDYYAASQSAFQVGREGSIFTRLKSILFTRLNGKDVEMQLTNDNDKISSIVNSVKANVNAESQDATIEMVNGNFVITPEIIGIRVQEELLREKIVSALMNSSIVEIPVEEATPQITEKMLSNITSKIGSFSTSFSGSSSGRIHNIKLAAELIDGSLILPSEIFSFNDITGEKKLETGYKKAPVIVNGEYTEGIGGGVCQVSSTLYNAALLADLEIVERYPHSIPAAYVSKGRDATVVDNNLDFKFKNAYENPIYINAKVNSNTITFEVYGKKNEDGRTIKIESIIKEKITPEVEEIVDTSLEPEEVVVVQEGRYGYKVETYKVILYNGKIEDKILITKDYYKPRKKTIRIGPELKPNIEEEEKNGGDL